MGWKIIYPIKLPMTVYNISGLKCTKQLACRRCHKPCQLWQIFIPNLWKHFEQKSLIRLLPGHLNIVTLTGSTVDADEDIRPIDPADRNCYFPDETETMKFYNVYSQSNCDFECSIEYAEQRMFDVFNTSCIPWYYPSTNSEIEFCDPWQSTDFFYFMFDEIPDETWDQ